MTTGLQWCTTSGASGAANSGVEQGGSGFQDIGSDLLGGGAIDPGIQVKDMGPDTAYAEGVGSIPP